MFQCYIISLTSDVVRWSMKRLCCVLYGPVKGLPAVCGLVKGLLNGPRKG